MPDALIADPSKSKEKLKWSAKTHWQELAELMVASDLAKLNQRPINFA